MADQSVNPNLPETVAKYANQPARQPSQQPANFLWVGEKGNQTSKEISLSTRQSFVRNRSLQIKRETQLRNLKASLKLPGRSTIQSSTQNNTPRTQEESRERADKPFQNSLKCRNIQAGLIQAFPRLTRLTCNMNEDPNFYYHHCKTPSTRAQVTFASNN